MKPKKGNGHLNGDERAKAREARKAARLFAEEMQDVPGYTGEPLPEK